LRRSFATPRLLGLALFLGLVLVYHANASVADEGDAVPSAKLAHALLETGKPSFDPERFPEMFKWRADPPLELVDGSSVPSWNKRFQGKTLGQWRKDGYLTLHGPRYFIVASPMRDAHLSTFGPIPGMFNLPFAALLHSIDPGLGGKPELQLAITKLTASLVIAGCAVLIFVTALRTTDRARALLAALVYGLGSCAWAVSSQTIWQQTVSQFLLVLGASCLLGAIDKPAVAALAGLAFGAALAVRVTAGVVLLSAFVFLCLRHPRSVLPFALGALPGPLAIAGYNAYYFGNPLVFAQGLVGHAVAVEKTGSPDLWQTPLWKGFLGLLVSPSRGLLIFSPVLALSAWGIVAIWRSARFESFRPLTIAALVMMAIQSTWFDWWGGWAYGYRPWFDVMPLLALFIVPVLKAATATELRRAVFGVAFSFSVLVQALGAFSYDRTWNDRELFLVQVPGRIEPLALLSEDEARGVARDRGGRSIGSKLCNIDFPDCRYRLWSMEDSLIVYQLTHFGEARARRLPSGWTGPFPENEFELSVGSRARPEARDIQPKP
jgi:hypothetical protein